MNLSKIWSRRSRVVVHAMVAVSRMQFLVKRWNQCHLHCHWDQHLSHRLCHFHLHHCLCRDSERHHNKHHNCITTTWQSFQHHDRWILQLHNCICIVIFCGIRMIGKIFQVEKVKEAWEEVWGAGKQSRGNFHHCHSHHHCHHDQPRLTRRWRSDMKQRRSRRQCRTFSKWGQSDRLTSLPSEYIRKYISKWNEAKVIDWLVFPQNISDPHQT